MIKSFTVVIFILSLSAYTERCGNTLLKNTAEITDSTLITISLPKNTYKIYEPIELVYEWINHKNTPDSIWALFSSSVYIKQFITDDKGNQFKQNLYEGSGVYGLNYVVLKGDTLRKTINLNQFGEKFTDQRGESIFHTSKYFRPGKYKMFSVIDNDAVGKRFVPPIRTNMVEFKITGLEEEENEIIKLVKEKKYEEALNLYPSGYFDEHIMYCDISEHISKFIRAGEDNDRYKDSSVLPSKYIRFFDKYPNSLYNLRDLFIIGYLRVSSRDSAGAHVKMNELKNRYPDTFISITVNDIIKSEHLRGRGVFIKGYHYKEGMGKSKEVNPQPPVEK